jgi:hypothetical protein
MKLRLLFVRQAAMLLLGAALSLGCGHENSKAPSPDTSRSPAVTPMTVPPGGGGTVHIRGIGTGNIGNLIALKALSAGHFYQIGMAFDNAPSILLTNAQVYTTVTGGPGVIGACTPGNFVVVPPGYADADGEAAIVPFYSYDGQNFYPFATIDKPTVSGATSTYKAHVALDRDDNTIIITVIAN